MSGNNSNYENPIETLTSVADKSALSELIRVLAATDLKTRRRCIDFLRNKVQLEPAAGKAAKSASLVALWDELEPELYELDRYGGGDYDTQDRVSELLSDLAEQTTEADLMDSDRDYLMEEVMRYIKSQNSGQEDCLYDVAFALCKTDDHWRELAGKLESLAEDWPVKQAMRIYRKISDDKSYLRLRLDRLVHGLDYWDLATFYIDHDQKGKAIEIAKEGVRKGQGRIEELEEFLAKQNIQ